MIELEKIKHRFLTVERLRDIDFLPEKKECIHIISSKQHEAFEIMPLFEKNNINECLLFNSNLNRKHFDYFTKLKAYINLKYDYDEKKEELPNYDRLIYNSNHSKIICIKSNENYYVLKGSGNLKRGGKMETCTLIEPRGTFFYLESHMSTLGSNP